MPRQARIDAAGAVHHIIIRGIERRKIYRQDADRINFLERLGAILQQTQTECYAWALIPNHAHILLRTGNVPIAMVMRRLLTGYAVSFNRKYNRHGKLFQNRYKSILCQEDIYLKELVRYIHLNPLRAKLVADLTELNRFNWSGHSAVTGRIQRQWQNTDEVLSLFGRRKSVARKQYVKFVMNGIPAGRQPDLVGGGLIRSAGGWEEVKAIRKSGIRLKGDERILGDSDFVENVLAAADEKLERTYQYKSKGYNLNSVIEKVSELLEMENIDLLGGGKQSKVVMARSLVCYFANSELGLTTVELSRRLNVCQSAVSRSVIRGKEIADKEGYKLF